MAERKNEYYFHEGTDKVLFFWDAATDIGWGWDADRGWFKSTTVENFRHEGDITWLNDATEQEARKKFPGAFRLPPGYQGDDERMDPDELTADEIASLAA